MSDQHPDIAGELRRGLRRLMAATLVLFLAIVLLGYLGWRSANHARADLQAEEARTTAALCTFRGDLAQRVNASQTFLLAHPHGIDGVSAASIQSSILSEERTIASLSTLQCPKGTP